MTISSGFFNSVSGDRKYNAKHFNEIFDGMLKDGIYTTIGDRFNVTAGTGMQVIVGTGRGWFKNTWIYNDAPVPINLSASDPVYSRIDAIVIDVNTGTQVRNNDVIYVIGTAASSPDKPTLVDEPTHKQYPLAWVTVRPGVTSITSDNITDCKRTGEIPAVEAILEYSSITKSEIDSRFNRDEKPVFSESQTEDNITSGESIFVIFGKIQKFINIIKNKLPVKYGGTGKNTITANSVLLGNGTDAVKEKTSNTGAFYSEGPGLEPQFGTLPVDKGGTGATTAAQALTNLGVPSDVSKAMSKDVYCSNDVNRSKIDPEHGGTGQASLQATRNAMGLGNTTGALPVANGGTGQTTLALARNAMGLGNTTGALPIANGGTGATTVAAARNALGLGNTSGAVPIANGGTGATTVAAARNALGLGNTTGALPVANGGTGQTSLQATRNAMGLGNTTGALPIANGGTGATSASIARDNLVVPPKNHASTSSQYGRADYNNYGHVRLSTYWNSPPSSYEGWAEAAGNIKLALQEVMPDYMPKSGGTFTGNIAANKGDKTESRISIGGSACNGVLRFYKAPDTGIGTPTFYYYTLKGNGSVSKNRVLTAPNDDGTIQVSSPSSRRIKENINDMSEDKAKKLLDINVVDFDYIGDFGGGLKNQCGVIAEDTFVIIPEAVEIPKEYDETKPVDAEKNPAPSVDYRKFIPYLIKMVQIQQKEIEELKAKSC